MKIIEAIGIINRLYKVTPLSEKKIALEMAEEALSKQIPEKITDDAEFGMCPNCHTEFNSELVNEYDIKYCPQCGQALDRGDY